MNSKRFIVGFIVVVVLIAAASIYVNFTVTKGERIITAVASPDGKFKAVTTTFARGGASPFCFRNIAVLPSIYPDDFDEHRKSYEVYAGRCGIFADGAPSPKMEWLSPTALQISLVPDAGESVRKDADITGAVHVIFEQRP